MSIAYDVHDGIARISFNRPAKLNAMTLAMYDELGRAFKAAAEDDRVRVVILTGAGERAFCAGADLKESIPALARNDIDISAWDAAHLKSINIDKPVICAVNGLCMGAGFEIMLATDLRIAASTAVFSLPEVTLGIVPAGGTLVRLVRQIGFAAAMEILMTGDRFTSEHLLRVGVLNRVVEPEHLSQAATQWAERLVRVSPTALKIIKQSVRELSDLPLQEAFRREAVLGQLAFTSGDAKRGLAAFAEGKKVEYY
ncbi:enoyl-CoA hydratase [Steroidobacter agaridevorans]|uniref:Enoyl-CoA hydratase n=1 Tax=Steroidobacter agaridevorans TaxID=2695856 RepID=A0A829YAF4_9GAMM|nr:enoyl-CoA hydratase/isomerase family protein [Steroidobacter agaridevorans]GFE80324.1 enoyl-CoA hydratase [Steroidobacter agaridevorans]GFE87377.1 enoyl-CoA hydratase [Steroidobacter agaridevorans]